MLWLADVLSELPLAKFFMYSAVQCLPLFLNRGLSGLCPFIRQTFNDASKYGTEFWKLS